MADSNPIPPDDNHEGKISSVPEAPIEMTDSTPNSSSPITEKPVGPDGKPLPGPHQVQQIRAQRQITQLHAQLDQLLTKTKSNLEQVIGRDGNLTKMEERAENLEDQGSLFERQASRAQLQKPNMLQKLGKGCLQHLKILILVGVVGTIGILFWSISIKTSISSLRSEAKEHG